MSLSSRVSALRQVSGPYQITVDSPLFWIRKDGRTAAVIFENVDAFLLFNDVLNHYFSTETAEIRNDGVVEIPLGVLQ